MKIIDCGGMGECLFSSIGYHLKKSGSEVRKEIVNKIRRDCSKIIMAKEKLCCLIRISEQVSIASYCQKMSLSTSSGGEIELFTASILYNKIIEVYQKRGDDFVLNYAYNGNETSKERLRLYYSSGHYQAIID